MPGGGGPCPSHRSGDPLTFVTLPPASDIRQLARGTRGSKRAGRVAEGKVQVTHSLAGTYDLSGLSPLVIVTESRPALVVKAKLRPGMPVNRGLPLGQIRFVAQCRRGRRFANVSR
jgi:hypothetical protein